MPCYKCSNGKYKYGERGRCQFDTLSACRQAEQAIHARENTKTLADCDDCTKGETRPQSATVTSKRL